MEQPEDQEFIRSSPVHRPEGVNASERYLAKLCERSFLSLWSYSSLTRDQGRKNGQGDGKELCDLLVVFGDDIIIFQDKECLLADSKDLQISWSRWYRAAIQEGAKQIWGAERWIKQHPELIFLNRLCTQPFPFNFPSPNTARYHRVIVAHGASERCKQELGGSGSLMIPGSLPGSSNSGANTVDQPFMIGQVDPAKGFVHIFDDTTLDIVLETLDTVSDFVAYLRKKEAFVSSDRFLYAAGEEELLAAYLTKLNADEEHDFMFPGGSFVMLSEGSWTKFRQNPQRREQLKANEVSYAWDALIEGFNKHNLAGTQYYVSHALHELEFAVRFLAGEDRTSRRFLAQSFGEIIYKTPADQIAVRVTKSLRQRGLYYVLMVLPHRSYSEEDYRVIRRNHLADYCMVAKLKFPEAEHIVGIATDAGINEYRSEDLVYYNATEWSEEERQEAERVQKEENMLNSVRAYQGNVQEYPDVGTFQQTSSKAEDGVAGPHQAPYRIGRNDPCPCGSGNKFKRCHGK